MEPLGGMKGPIYLRHHLWIGIGNWGRETLGNAALALEQSHPERLENIDCMDVSEDQICIYDWLISPISNLFDPARHWKPEPGTAPITIQKNLVEKYPEDLSAYDGLFNAALLEAIGAEKTPVETKSRVQSVRTDQSILDIHILGQIEDPLVQATLFSIARSLRKEKPAALRFRLFFYLASDSSKWKTLADDPKNALRNFFNCLEAYITEQYRLAENVRNQDNAIFGMCYFVDPVNEWGHGIPVPQKQISQSGSQMQALSKMTASFLALLAYSEIPEHSSYESFFLYPWIQRARASKDKGYCSSFGLSSQVFPIFILRRMFLLKKAAEILNYFNLARMDRTHENHLKHEFLAHHQLDHTQLHDTLGRSEKNGQPIRFPFDPSRLDEVPETALVDRILSWDASVERNNFLPAVEAVKKKAEELQETAAQWIATTVDKLITDPGGETGTAYELCKDLIIELERERDRRRVREVKKKSWIRSLFASEPFPAPGSGIPNLEPLKLNLQNALGNQALRLATWARQAIQAAIESTFLLVAWPYLATAIKSILPASQNLSTLPVDLIAVSFLIVLIVSINALLAFNTIYASESRIYTARNRLIRAIQAKYEALFQSNLERCMFDTYSALVGRLEEEKAQVKAWSERASELAREFEKMADQAPLVELPSHEEFAVSPDQISAYLPEVEPDDMKLVFAHFVEEPYLISNWRTIHKSLLSANLMRFITKQLASRLSGLSLERFLENTRGPSEFPAQASHLQADTPIQLVLTGLGEDSDNWRQAYLGVDDQNKSRAVIGINRNQIIPITTHDPSHLTFLITVHGLPLQKLIILEDLL